MTDTSALNDYTVNVNRIEGLLSWGQKLNETDTTFYRTHLLARWENVKKRMDELKAEEMDLRKKLVAHGGFDPDKLSGTERVPLENGYSLKAVKKLNYGFVKTPEGKTNKEAIENALRAIEAKAGPELGRYITDNLVKWTPDLSLTEYKKLSEMPDGQSYVAIIDTVIVKTPGAPTLEIEAPKGKK